MKGMAFSKKIIMMASAVLLAIILALGIISYFSISSAYTKVIGATKEQLDVYIKGQVECLIGVLEANYQSYLDGGISEDEAKLRAENIVRSTRYNGGVGYFWADRSDGTNAVHINPEVEGTNRYNTQDEQGNYFVRDTIDAGNQPDGGYIDFYFTKPNGSEALLKRGYVKKFAPYDWYIGTGNYQEDMEALIQAQLDDASKKQMTSILSICAAGIAMLVMAIIALRIVLKKSLKPLVDISEIAEQVACGNLNVHCEAGSDDEIGRTAVAFQKIVDATREQISALEDLANGNLTEDVRPRGDNDSMSLTMNKMIDQLNVMFSNMIGATKQVASMSDQISGGA